MSSLVIQEATERAAQLRSALAARVVIADGAMGTMLQESAATADDFEGYEGCNEVLNATRPDIIAGIHRAYFVAREVADEFSAADCPDLLLLRACTWWTP
jgi:5-methyltetrahydrofolate--homocysteine methyltransferase